MSYAIVSCVHGRPALTEAWAKHLATHFDGPVVIAGDDPELYERCERQLRNNLIWVPYYNFPLAAKWNRAAERAIKVASHLVILGSDDFPSPELFGIWKHITTLSYKWVCLDSLYFYSTQWKEVSQLTSRYGFGTGRMFPSYAVADLFNHYGYAWTPSLQQRLDADLFQNLGHPEDDIVLSSNESCWILAVKVGEQQINSYDKIRAAHPTMLTIEQPSRQLENLIIWIRNQAGMKATRLPNGKLSNESR